MRVWLQQTCIQTHYHDPGIHLYFVGILISGKYNPASIDIIQMKRIDTGTLERSETREIYAFQDHL